MKSIVVTGASTGIGWGCVKVLVRDGFHVFGSVRKVPDGERLSREFGERFTPLVFDVTDEAAVAAGARQVATALANGTLFGLVNNAGIAVSGPLLYLAIDDFKHQFAVNLTGQLIVTQAFAPLLGADRARQGSPGRIVMMSSIAGRNGWPFLGAYASSKFALEGMAESLRRELILFGIDVIVVGPGAIATPIWDKAEGLDTSPLANTPYGSALRSFKDYAIENGRKGLPPEAVGEAVKKALTVSRPKTRYTVTPNPIRDFLVSNLPKRVVDRIIARQLGFR
jgi:NAD(P)-dependent dehydrogenase (short-subunit alcohol dehydrogenase family)